MRVEANLSDGHRSEHHVRYRGIAQEFFELVMVNSKEVGIGRNAIIGQALYHKWA